MALLLSLLACVTRHREAWAEVPLPLPTVEQAPLLLKVLSFDQTRMAPDDPAVHIGIVELGDGDEGAALEAELETYSELRLGGRPFVVRRAGPDGLEPEGTAPIDVLFLCGNVEPVLPQLLQWALKRRLLTVTGTPAWEARGVAIAFAEEAGRPAILINLPAAKALGRELDARLLALAQVRR